ncbi:hypothetical protein ACFLTK_01865 [Chloroflexota bacterium]
MKTRSLVVTGLTAFILFVFTACATSGERTVEQTGHPSMTSTDGMVTLYIPDEALPEEVKNSDIKMEPLNIYDLPDDMPELSEDNITVAVMELGPNGLVFNEPITFQMTIPSQRDILYTVFHISSSGSEAVEDVSVEFNAEEKITLVTGKISHFSFLAAGKNKADETIEEFVARAKADIADSKAKAEGVTYWSEKAKHYRNMVDKAYKYHKEGANRFPDTMDSWNRLPDSINGYGETKAMIEYAKYKLLDLDWIIEQEKDPIKRFELLKERLEVTMNIQAEFGWGYHDERLIPNSINGFKETQLLRDQGDFITQEILDSIYKEVDDVAKENLKEQLREIINWLFEEGMKGNYDERITPRYEKWEQLFDVIGGPNPFSDPSAAPLTTTPAVTTTVYPVEISVLIDKGGHASFIGKMPSELTVEVTDSVIDISGGGAFVPVSGEQAADGTITATGSGTVAKRKGTSVSFTGQLTDDGITGEYTMGGNKTLPGGKPITYSVE